MKKITDEERSIIEQYFIPYFHIAKRFPLLPGKKDKNLEAALFGLSVDELDSNRQNLFANAKQASLELLKDDAFVEYLDKLPFDGFETIVGVGDSNTEDDQGWFSIFANVLDLYVDNADFNFINAGLSENSTTDVLRRFDRDVLIHEPDWVIINVGLFDAQRLNIIPNRTLLPLSESWENLNSIQELLSESVSNSTVWITPGHIIPELVDNHALYDFSFDLKDLMQINELISGKNGIIIDPQGSRMGKPDAWNFLSDGLLHSLTGHMNTVRELVKGLARD